MNLLEAARKWECKPEKVIEYLYKKNIEGITFNGTYIQFSEIDIPDIPKPDKTISQNNLKKECICRKILKAYSNGRYVNSTILRISKEDFEKYLLGLYENGYLKKSGKSDDPCIMLRYELADAGVDAISSRCFNINIESLSLIRVGEVVKLL